MNFPTVTEMNSGRFQFYILLKRITGKQRTDYSEPVLLRAGSVTARYPNRNPSSPMPYFSSLTAAKFSIEDLRASCMIDADRLVVVSPAKVDALSTGIDLNASICCYIVEPERIETEYSTLTQKSKTMVDGYFMEFVPTEIRAVLSEYFLSKINRRKPVKGLLGSTADITVRDEFNTLKDFDTIDFIKGVYSGMHVPGIKKVIYHDPATIVYWYDGTKTVVKASGEPFNKEHGLAMAIARKYFKGRRCDFKRTVKNAEDKSEVKEDGEHA